MAKKTETTTKGKTASASEGKATVTKRSQQVRKAIQEANRSIETNHLNLAKLLHEAFTKEYAPQWGYEDFEAFCSSEVGVGYRKARYMVDIWAKVSERNIPTAALSKIGWSKLKEICSVMTDAFNVHDEDLIKMASDLSLRDLTEEIKKIRTAGGTNRNPSTYKVTIQVGESANKVIMEALEEAKKITENTDTGVALEMICQDWLMEKGKVPERTDIKDFVAYLESMYGVSITVKAKKGEKGKVAEVKEQAKTETKAKGKAKGKSKAAEEPKETTKAKAKGKAKGKGKAKQEEELDVTDDTDLDDLLGNDADEGDDSDLDDLLGGDDDGADDDLASDDQEIDELLGLGSD